MTLLYYSIFLVSIFFYIKVCVKNVREGLLVGFIFTTFTFLGFPSDLIQINLTFILPIAINIIIIFIYLFTNNKSKISFRLNKYQLLLFIYLLFVVLYIIPSKAPEYAIHKTLLFIGKSVLPVFTMSCFFPLRKKDIHLIFSTIIVGASLTSVRLLYQSDFSLYRTHLPLSYARTIGLGVLLILITLIYNKQISKKTFIIYSLLLAINIISLALTGSRGPLFGIIFTLFYVIMFSIFIKRQKPLIFLRFLKMVIIIGLVLLSISTLLSVNFLQMSSVQRITQYLPNILSGADGRELSQSDVMRITHLQYSWRGFINSYGLGVGTGGYAYLRGLDGSYPHNVFLESAVEQGIFGLIVVIGIVILSIQRMNRIMLADRLGSYEFALNTLWLYGLFNALVSSDISGNLLWVTLLFLWSPKDCFSKLSLINSTPKSRDCSNINTKIASTSKSSIE
jgi:hypothetical protein